MSGKKQRGYISPTDYADHAIDGLERALETDASIKSFNRPIKDLIAEVRSLRAKVSDLETVASRAQAKVERLHEKLTAAMELTASVGEQCSMTTNNGRTE